MSYLQDYRGRCSAQRELPSLRPSVGGHRGLLQDRGTQGQRCERWIGHGQRFSPWFLKNHSYTFSLTIYFSLMVSSELKAIIYMLFLL